MSLDIPTSEPPRGAGCRRGETGHSNEDRTPEICIERERGDDYNNIVGYFHELNLANLSEQRLSQDLISTIFNYYDYNMW